MTLITQLFLSLQSRPDADMTDFFRFENQKSHRAWRIEGRCDQGRSPIFYNAFNAPNGRAIAAKQATVVVLDMAAVIHMVRHTAANTFSEYVPLHNRTISEGTYTQ